MILLRPLLWPAGVPRRAFHARKPGPFSVEARRRQPSRRISLDEALGRLEAELEMWSTPTRQEAQLRADFAATRAGNVSRADVPLGGDPGAVLAFAHRGRPYVLPADAYTELAQNVAALAAHLWSQRATVRHGVATLEDLMRHAELPPPSSPGQAGLYARTWRDVLADPKTLEDAERRYRELAKILHPDASDGPGSHAAMVELNLAIEEARRELA